MDPVGANFLVDVWDQKETMLTHNIQMPSYIVMKTGMSMQQWVRNRKPPPLMGIWMLSEVCSLVAKLHSTGLVHRDLVRFFYSHLLRPPALILFEPICQFGHPKNQNLLAKTTFLISASPKEELIIYLLTVKALPTRLIQVTCPTLWFNPLF